MNELDRGLYRNGRFIAPDGLRPEPCSLYVHDGRIAGLGAAEELVRRFGPPHRDEDLRGRTVVPGLTDAHCHLVGYGVELIRDVDLLGCGSVDEMIERLRAHGDQTDDPWLVGTGFDQERLRERRFPTRDELDAAFPGRPVVVTRVCWHALVANGRALEAARVSSASGLLTEDDTGPVLDAIPEPSDATMEGAVVAAAKRYRQSGFTGAHVLVGSPAEMRALQAARRDGTLGLRIEMIVPYAWIPALESTGMTEGFGDEWLRLAGVKSFADGSLGARTASMREPYADDWSTRGVRLLTVLQLVRRLRRARRAGLRSAVHAIGDAAVEAVVTAAERTRGAGPPPRIEHASITDPRLAVRMARLGMSAAVQPQFIRSDFWTPRRLGLDRASWAYPFRTLVDTGVRLAGSTDCPVERPIAAEVIDGFMARPDGNDREVLNAAEVLESLTTGAELSLGIDRGPLWSAGRLADFLVYRPGAEWPGTSESRLPIERVVVHGRDTTLEAD